MISDRIFGLVVLIVAAGYVLAATQIQTSFLADPVGPRMFPYLVGGAAAVCGLVVLIKPDPDPTWPGLRTFGALIFSVIVLVAYAYSLKPLGFLIPTALAAGIISFQIHPRVATAAAAGIGLSVGLYVLFKYGLGLETLKAVPKSWGG